MKRMSKTTLTLSALLAAGALLVGLGISCERSQPAAPAWQLRPYGGLETQRTDASPQRGSFDPSARPANISAVVSAIDASLVDINATLGDQGRHTLATEIVLAASGPGAHQQPCDRRCHNDQRH